MSSVKFNKLKLTNVSIVTSDVITVLAAINQNQKLIASDNQLGDEFGHALDINSSGNTIIVGAHQEDTGGTGAGSSYIFTKNSSDIWSERQKIQASDKQSGDIFGYSVAIDGLGNTTVIGAHRENTGGSNAGAAYVFTKNSSDIWSEKQKLLSSDIQAYDFFGYSVAVNSEGNTAVIGANHEDTGGVDAGAAYIFTKNSSDIWSQRQKIQASDKQASDFFGDSVAINSAGTLAIIGAASEDTGGTDAGAVYVFTKNSSDIWSERQKLLSSDLQAGDQFGISLDINAAGNIAIIGASYEDTGATSAGSSYIFTKNASDIWNESQKIQASDILAQSHFGSSVSINDIGDMVVIGAFDKDQISTLNAGAVYIFTKNSSDVWNQYQKLQASDFSTNNYFGIDVCIDSVGANILAGANGNSSDAGAAYFFKSNFSDTPIGGVLYNTVVTNEVFVMKSDSTLRIKL